MQRQARKIAEKQVIIVEYAEFINQIRPRYDYKQYGHYAPVLIHNFTSEKNSIYC